METIEKVANDYAEMWEEEGIIYQVYKPELNVNLAVAKLLVAERLRIAKGKSRPMFVDISNLVSIDQEAREYFSEEEATQLITAGAIYTATPIAKLAGNFFIDVNQPLINVKLFTDKPAAIEWLQGYK